MMVNNKKREKKDSTSTSEDEAPVKKPVQPKRTPKAVQKKDGTSDESSEYEGPPKKPAPKVTPKVVPKKDETSDESSEDEKPVKKGIKRPAASPKKPAPKVKPKVAPKKDGTTDESSEDEAPPKTKKKPVAADKPTPKVAPKKDGTSDESSEDEKPVKKGTKRPADKCKQTIFIGFSTMPSKYSGYHRLSKISKREVPFSRHSSRRKRSPSSDRKEIRKTPWDYGRSGSSDKKIFDVMEIPFNLVPFVIGIYGHRIKEIQADSGCQIKIHSDITSNGTHICNFYGRKANIENARKMINDIVKLYPTAAVTGKDEKIVLSYSKVIKIPSNKCGFIVGENGEILKNLQMKYNVEMKIICQRVSHGTKLLHITGSTRNVKDAYDEVENIINDISSTALVVPREAVGPIMGKCGQNLMWFSSKSGCKINLEPLESPNATEQSAILHGTVQQIANAIHMISKLLRYCSKNVEKHSGYFHVGFDELETICW